MATDILELDMVDYQKDQPTHGDDLAGLRTYLACLIGTPFQFVRFIYPNVLTLHFGNLRSGRSPKMKGKKYGDYIVNVFGSAWVMKSETASAMITGGISVFDPSSTQYKIKPEAIEKQELVEKGSVVIAAIPVSIKQIQRFGLVIELSDATAFTLLPTSDFEFKVEGQEETEQVADWEVLTPNGVLTAGPGPNWKFKPKKQV